MSVESELAKLLDLVGRDPEEHLSICHQNGDGTFHAQVTTVADAGQVAAFYSDGDTWYGTSVLHHRVTSGRGSTRDVIGVRELFADLDVKASGMKTLADALDVIGVLENMLGSEPVAIVATGHGLHPHWAIERGPDTDWPDETDARHGAAVALVRRWGRLVAHVAARHGGAVDTVCEPARVMRSPGSVNRKDPARPEQVGMDCPGGAPVSLSRLREVLAEYGIPERVEDSECLGAEVSSSASWTWASVTCPYITAMVRSWATDTPKARHPWLLSQFIRLACAHRAGCITEADHAEAVGQLLTRFRALLAAAPSRAESPGEVWGVQSWAIARASSHTDARVIEELGHHSHHGEDYCAAQVTEAGISASELTDGSLLRNRLPILDWYELWNAEDTEEWIVEPILPARRLVAIYSAPKVGKSLLMLEIAVAVSRGTSVLGVTPDRPRRVLYVDFENDPRGDVRSRLQAMGVKPADLDGLAYLSFPVIAGLDSAGGGELLLAAVAEYEVEVVIIDTVSRSVRGEENANDTWLNFYRHTGSALKRVGVALVRLDHSGKDAAKGQRGGSAKSGDVDAVWRLSRVTDTVFRLDCEDARMQVTEKTLVLHREANPLRHRVDGRGRAASNEARITDLIAALDAAGLASSAGQPAAREVLRHAGIKVSNIHLAEVVKRRKVPGRAIRNGCGEVPGEELSGIDGDSSRRVDRQDLETPVELREDLSASSADSSRSDPPEELSPPPPPHRGDSSGIGGEDGAAREPGNCIVCTNITQHRDPDGEFVCWSCRPDRMSA